MKYSGRWPRTPSLLGLAALPVVVLGQCAPGCEPPPEDFVITEISLVGPTAYDLTPNGRFVLFTNGDGAAG